MPSKLSVHLNSYPSNAFDVLERMQPSIVKIFNQSSEMNIDEIRRRCPNTLIVYRHYSTRDYHEPAERFFDEMRDTLNKLRGRGIIWEGINEPIVQTADDARALNAWTVRFAQLMHNEGELVAGFCWSTGNPTPDKLPIVLPHLVDAAAAVDVHAFHEYYKQNGGQTDWRRYRDFERALPAHARKPIIITEAGWDDNGDPYTGGYRGKVSEQQYLEILKQYDAALMQDPYVLGATVFQWGDGAWPSFELAPMIHLFAAYVQQSGGLVTPKPWPKPTFEPTFTVTPQTIIAGQNATLRWDVPNAREVRLDGQRVNASGTKTVSPTQTTTYTLQVTFNDNTTQTLTQTLTVTPAGTLKITNVTFSPTTLRIGDVLNVSITVVNGTAETLQTQGPDPGFVYDEGDTFRSRGFPETRNAIRVGVDLDAGTAIDHPYRWGLGAPLAPGESRIVTGAIRVKTGRAVKYWAGLVRELVTWLQDRQGEQVITVTPVGSGTVSITSVSLTPTTVNTGDVLNVSITVRNDTANTLPTQGPDPGFVYEEGDTFRSRGFTETQGAYRVGIDFEGRGALTIDHPYRWGFGAPLAPGESRTISGAIRLKTTRASNYWAGLVREKIAWLQDKQGTQKITVIAAPRLSFTATPSIILPGQSSRLKWEASEARSVTLDGQPVAAQGTYTVMPTQTTTYTLRVVLKDGSTRELTTTVVVTGLAPTRPPTVTITPENIARLKTYPRPANDNGRGLHFHIDLSESTIATVVSQLRSIGCTWTMIYARDENQAQRAARACWNAGIMPVVRIGKKVDEPFDPVVYVNKLKEIGVPPYVQIYNEPGDNREWKNWPGDDRWASIFGARWAQAAIAVYDAGGYPGLQILGREEFDAAVDSVAAQGRTDIWQRAFFALHNYGANHPPNYPYDPLTNKTIFEDDVSVLVFLLYAAWMKEKIGFVLPIIGGEGGWQYGAHEDPRYPRIEAALHARYHAEMFDWFRTGVISNGEPLPDYLFSITPWIAGGWGGDDWWGGPLGDKTATINAVGALPPFIRKFSWETQVPIPTYSFTATPSTITAGESATLQWSTTNATRVTLNGETVATSGTRVVTPAQTTTYVLRIVFADGTTQEARATVTVNPAPTFPPLQWDTRLDALGVKLTRAPDAHAWRLISAVYQDETQSGGNHNVYYKLLKADGTPAASVRILLDWKDRPPQDDPAYVTTDANGETNCPLWAILHPELKDGPYFTRTVNEPSDTVSGMGLPVNRHVNFVLTYKWV